MKAAATNRLVLDASVTLSWCFPEESSKFSEAILDLLSSSRQAVVPALWPFEVANALLVGERRKRLSFAQVISLLQRIAQLPITIIPTEAAHVFGPVLSLAREQKLTEYDAAYLELAVREGLPLATLDENLRRAAKSIGVSLFT